MAGPWKLRGDAETQPFLDGVADGRIILSRCGDCGETWLLPHPHCPNCRSPRFGQLEASGAGTLYSVTNNHRPLGPAFATRVPYAIAIVTLAEGPTIMADLLGEADIGDPLHFVPVSRDDGSVVVGFVRDER